MKFICELANKFVNQQNKNVNLSQRMEIAWEVLYGDKL